MAGLSQELRRASKGGTGSEQARVTVCIKKKPHVSAEDAKMDQKVLYRKGKSNIMKKMKPSGVQTMTRWTI